MEIHGHIVWKRNDNGKTCDYGIRFDNVSQIRRNVIRDYVNEMLANQ